MKLIIILSFIIYLASCTNERVIYVKENGKADTVEVNFNVEKDRLFNEILNTEKGTRKWHCNDFGYCKYSVAFKDFYFVAYAVGDDYFNVYCHDANDNQVLFQPFLFSKENRVSDVTYKRICDKLLGK